MTSFRNEYAAHRQLDSSRPVPALDTAFRITHFYDKWIRKVILPDVFDEPSLHISEAKFTSNARPLIEALMNQTKQMEETIV